MSTCYWQIEINVPSTLGFIFDANLVEFLCCLILSSDWLSASFDFPVDKHTFFRISFFLVWLFSFIWVYISSPDMWRAVIWSFLFLFWPVWRWFSILGMGKADWISGDNFLIDCTGWGKSPHLSHCSSIGGAVLSISWFTFVIGITETGTLDEHPGSITLKWNVTEPKKW